MSVSPLKYSCSLNADLSHILVKSVVNPFIETVPVITTSSCFLHRNGRNLVVRMFRVHFCATAALRRYINFHLAADCRAPIARASPLSPISASVRSSSPAGKSAGLESTMTHVMSN